MSNPKTLDRMESEYDMDMSSYQQFPLKVKENKTAKSHVKISQEPVKDQQQLTTQSGNVEVDNRSNDDQSWHSESERMDRFQDQYDEQTGYDESPNVDENDLFGAYSPAFVSRYDQYEQEKGEHGNASAAAGGTSSADEEWIKVFDDDSRHYYYFNQITGDSTWEPPPGYKEPLDATYQTTYGAEASGGLDSTQQWGNVDTDVTQTWTPTDELRDTISSGADLTYKYNPSGSMAVASSDDEADVDSAEGGLALERNLLATAYGGLYRPEELLEDERDRIKRKFDSMKVGGAVMRSRLGWDQWLSAQGAIFYAQKDTSGGQWQTPEVFQRLDAENSLKEKSKDRLKKKTYMEEEKKKANAFSFMLEGWEQKRGSTIGGPGYDNLDGLVQGTLIRDVFEVKHRDGSVQKRRANNRPHSPDKRDVTAQDFAFDKEVSEEMLDALEEQQRYDEYGNSVKLADRYNKPGLTSPAGKATTSGMKLIYKALRDRDVEVDIAMDAQALEKRTDKAKERWKQYLEMKSERERSIFGAKMGSNEDEDSEDDDHMNFTKLYSRSIIVGQKWPWTKLIDIESDRQFYRNEMEDYFQFDAPPEFGGVVKVEKGGLVKGGGAHQISGKRRQGLMGGLQETATDDEFGKDKPDPNSAVYLREKFNSEIQARREHFAKQNKIVRELERGNTEVDVRSLSPSRRMKAALQFARGRSTNGSRGPNMAKGGGGLRKNSVFFRGSTVSRRDALEDLLPPERYRTHDEDDKYRWRDLSDVQNCTLGGIAEEIGWHDCSTLLMRLRRFADLRHFMDQMNGQVNSRGSGVLVKGGLESASHVRGGNDGTFKNRGSESLGGGPSDFVCGTLNRFRYSDAKTKHLESLEEVSRLAAQRRMASHYSKHKTSQVKNAVSSFRALVDITCDDPSCLETEVTRRHLLEAAVLLKCSLTRPVRKHETTAYNGLRTYTIASHCLKAADLTNIPCQEVIELQRWNVHIFHTNHLTSSTKDPKPRDVLILYAKKTNGRVQLGVPFDLKFKQWDQAGMKRLRWYDNGKMYSGLRYGKRLVDLMCDENDGILFYCPVREVYSWKKAMDASYYDVLSDTHGSGKGALQKASVKKAAELEVGVSTESTEENAAKANRIIKANMRAYRSMAVIERRATNIWADLDMTKPANRGVSMVVEESDGGSKGRVGGKRGSPQAAAIAHVELSQDGDMKFKVNKFKYLISKVLISSYIRPSYTQPSDSAGPRITAYDEPDKDALEFEDEFNTEDYVAYTDLMFELLDRPEHVPTLLSFCEFLMTKNLGRETVMVLVRILEVTNDHSFPTPEDLAALVLVTVRLYCRFMSDFRVVDILKECAELCPESALVLSLVARIFHTLRLHSKAEELYVGALLLNPMHPDGLRGYGILLAEKGNYNAASRYLSRVSETSTMFHMAKTEFAWTLEILGNRDDALLLAYQAVLTNGQKNRATSLSLASMGHFFHVRGDCRRAIDFYSRSFLHSTSNAYGLIMHACAHATLLTNSLPTSRITTYTTLKGSKTRPDDFLSPEDRAPGIISRPGLNCRLEPNKDEEEIDAKFRRGLFYLKGTNRWIGLLSCAEFIACKLRDMVRAEDVFWEAARLSSTHTVWPSVALAHFYLYIRDDVTGARRVLTWAAAQREIPSEKESFDDDDNDDGDVNDDIPNGMNAPISNHSEEASVCVAHAYCHFSRKEYRDAVRCAKNALSLDGRSGPALRCWGLVEWCQGHRSNALVLFKKSLKAFPNNPYCLRNYAVASALCGHYSDALSKMVAAAEIGGNISPLAWRAAGQMAYIYDPNPSGRINANKFLQRSFELSGGMDFEAGRLRAQILMELGHFEEAVELLRSILHLKPCDPVALGSLGLCISALGYVSTNDINAVNYDLRIKLLDDPLELSLSTDPEELLEAATTFNLAQVFLQKSGNSKGANLDRGWSILQNYSYEEPIDPLTAHDTDVPPIVLYWYGMYCLQKGGKESVKKAKTLFLRASQRADYPPYLLALHKLGWLSETKRDMRTAERYYCHALQLEPVEPYAFLQLSQLVRDTHQFVSILVEHKQESMGHLKGDVGDIEGSDKRRNKRGGKRKKSKKNPMAAVLTNKDDEGLDYITLQKRLLLHDRVNRLCELRKSQMKTHLKGLCIPGKFVYFEPFWLETYMDCFDDCEDWAWLLKCSHEFRTKAVEKKEHSQVKGNKK